MEIMTGFKRLLGESVTIKCLITQNITASICERLYKQGETLVLKTVLLKLLDFWDDTVCCWVNSCWVNLSL